MWDVLISDPKHRVLVYRRHPSQDDHNHQMVEDLGTRSEKLVGLSEAVLMVEFEPARFEGVLVARFEFGCLACDPWLLW